MSATDRPPMAPEQTTQIISAALPDDMADAYEQLKLAIMRQRAENWSQVSSDTTIQALWELQRLAM
jgi:hypothetical protein